MLTNEVKEYMRELHARIQEEDYQMTVTDLGLILQALEIAGEM
jgi:hypothetical protein